MAYSKTNSFFEMEKENVKNIIVSLSNNNINNLSRKKKKIVSSLIEKYPQLKNCDTYIINTIDLFLQNKVIGKNLLNNLYKILSECFLDIRDFLKENYRNYYELFTNNMDLKINNYINTIWFYTAFNRNKSAYLKANIIMPFYPFLTQKKDMILLSHRFYYNIKDIDNFRKNFKFKKKEFEEFPAKWRMNEEWNYAREYIDKYIFKIKNRTKDTAIYEIIKFPLGALFVIKYNYIKDREFQNDVYFVGTAENFIKIQKEYDFRKGI